MIAFLHGEVIGKGDDFLVVLVSGVGFHVHAPKPLCRVVQLKEQVQLFTSLIVREDLLALYGFGSEEERDLFLLLLSVNGVGPRLSLTCLSAMDVNTIRRAIAAEEAEILARVPGLGKKTAQKIILSLQGKIGALSPLEQIGRAVETDADIIDALTSLGYSVVEAQAALQSLPREGPKELEERLRLALKYFSG